jgi:hypothetical protein
VIPPPWTMTAPQIAFAERAVREIVADDLGRLLVPVLHAGHVAVIQQIMGLRWSDDPLDILAPLALGILTAATRAGGPLDPAQDDADIPWVSTITRTTSVPETASLLARQWFAHLERTCWQGSGEAGDEPVSAILMSVAAYVCAYAEDLRGSEYEAWRWMQMAAIQAEMDGRPGLGLVAHLRAARLMTKGMT